MEFQNPLEDSGLSEKINHICGTTNVLFSNKAKVSNVNDALDRYFFLASELDGSFDDSNRTGAPIETQSIVSGTNAYKFSDFTNEVLTMLQLGILDSDSNEATLTHEDIENMDNFGDLYKTSDTGVPTHWTRLGDYIYLRPTPDYALADALRAYVGRIPDRYAFTSFTVTQATPAVFTAVAHGLVLNDTIILETDGTLLTGLTADTVQYYIITAGLTADAFQVSLTKGGTAVNTTATQSGNHTFLKTSKEPGIPTIHHLYLARYASLPYLVEKNLPQKNDVSNFVRADEQAILDYFSRREKDIRDVITTKKISYR